MFSDDVHLYEINAQGLISIPLDSLDLIDSNVESQKQYWLDIRSSEKEIVKTICHKFDIHPSLAEDIIALRNQSAKAEILDNYVFWVARFSESFESKHYQFKKICTFLLNNFVITFRDPALEKSSSLLKRFNKSLSIHHANHADFLALLFLDITLDAVFRDIDIMTEQLEFLEEMAMQDPNNFNLKQIYTLKRKIIFLRKLINPILGVSSMLRSVEKSFLNMRAKILLQKIHDLCYRANEVLDLYQQMINNIYEMYLSTTNFYTNRSITLLTQFSTVFIPISFITGVYGMNFRFMPEIYYRYSYPIVLGVMATLGIGLWYYFRKYHR
jgi:magnesium transporter